MLTSLVVLFLVQDLMERNRVVVKKQFTKERIELQTAVPIVERSGRKEISVGATGESRHSFLCGRFDPMAGIRSLVTEDIASEATAMLVDVAQGELVANGLTLLCQVSPTLCDVLKHYRASASALLKLNYDKCRAIDDAMDNATRRMQAEATRACLERKYAQGKSLPEAMRECEREYQNERLRDLGGEHVKEIELNKQLEKVFGRGDPELLDPIKLGPYGANGKVQVDRVAALYEEAREKYLSAWKEGKTEGLVPEWVGFKVTQQDLTALTAMDERRRAIVLEQLASDLAVLEIAKRIQEMDAKLAAAKVKADLTPGTPLELSKQLEAQRGELSRALEELLTTRRIQRLAGETFARFLDRTYENEVRLAGESLKKMAGDKRRDPGVGKGFYPTYSTGCCTTEGKK